jgi:hypothetical protein
VLSAVPADLRYELKLNKLVNRLQTPISNHLSTKVEYYQILFASIVITTFSTTI